MTISNRAIGAEWHRWNCLREGKSNGRNINLSYSGPVLYSRSTPIACYYGSGENSFILAYDGTHSPSTSGQLTRVLSFAHIPRCFRVPYIGHSGGWHREPPMPLKELIEKNAEAWATKFGNLCQFTIKSWRVASGSDVSDTEWENTIRLAYEGLLGFIHKTGANYRPLELDAILADIRADRRARYDAWNHPDAKARRDRAHARRIALKAFDLA